MNPNLSTTIKHVTDFIGSFRLGQLRRGARPHPAAQSLKVAGYSLVLMDADGQVVFAREWDAGGVFDFGPHHRLWVNCEFTNQTGLPVDITEYEVELRSLEGDVIKTFNGSFGNPVTVAPGHRRVFPARWQL